MYKAWDKIRNKPMFSIEKDPPPLFEDGGCDLILVIGTALAVSPFNNTLYMASDDCPKVLINMTNNREHGFDFDNLYHHPERLLLQGKCDEICAKIKKDVGW
jgi:NAD-dependent SIR2 family protein deacetylase